jgi:hypothetical protein
MRLREERPSRSKHVAFAQLVEGGAQLRTIVSGSARLLVEHPLSPGPCQRIALQIEILVSGADPRAADQHDGNPGGGILPEHYINRYGNRPPELACLGH